MSFLTHRNALSKKIFRCGRPNPVSPLLGYVGAVSIIKMNGRCLHEHAKYLGSEALFALMASRQRRPFSPPDALTTLCMGFGAHTTVR